MEVREEAHLLAREVERKAAQAQAAAAGGGGATRCTGSCRRVVGAALDAKLLEIHGEREGSTERARSGAKVTGSDLLE